MPADESQSNPGEYRPSFDRAFLLRLLARANPSGHHMGAVKPNKFTFLVSRFALESGMPGFRYRFIKDRLGPKSITVYTDLAWLQAAGLVNRDGAVSAKGTIALRALEPFFETEPQLTRLVDRVAQSYGRIPRYKLVDQVHQMMAQVGGATMTIGEAPQGAVLLDPALGTTREVPEDWGETLELVFDAEGQSRLAASEEDVRAGRVRPFDSGMLDGRPAPS